MDCGCKYGHRAQVFGEVLQTTVVSYDKFTHLR